MARYDPSRFHSARIHPADCGCAACHEPDQTWAIAVLAGFAFSAVVVAVIEAAGWSDALLQLVTR